LPGNEAECTENVSYGAPQTRKTRKAGGYSAMKKVTLIGTGVLLTFLITSCGADRGSAERVGQNVDKPVENSAERSQNEGPAGKAGQKLHKAVQQVADGVKKVGEAVVEAVGNEGGERNEKAGGGPRM
jgi:hypothetical protein